MIERGVTSGRNLVSERDGHGNEDSRMRDQEIREALNQHWAASDSGDFATEHGIYQDDAVLDLDSPKDRESPEGVFERLGKPQS